MDHRGEMSTYHPRSSPLRVAHIEYRPSVAARKNGLLNIVALDRAIGIELVEAFGGWQLLRPVQAHC